MDLVASVRPSVNTLPSAAKSNNPHYQSIVFACSCVYVISRLLISKIHLVTLHKGVFNNLPNHLCVIHGQLHSVTTSVLDLVFEGNPRKNFFGSFYL